MQIISVFRGSNVFGHMTDCQCDGQMWTDEGEKTSGLVFNSISLLFYHQKPLKTTDDNYKWRWLNLSLEMKNPEDHLIIVNRDAFTTGNTDILQRKAKQSKIQHQKHPRTNRTVRRFQKTSKKSPKGLKLDCLDRCNQDQHVSEWWEKRAADDSK